MQNTIQTIAVIVSQEMFDRIREICLTEKLTEQQIYEKALAAFLNPTEEKKRYFERSPSHRHD